MLKKTLEITLLPTSDNTFDVEIYEPESGDHVRINCHDTGDTTEENAKIINEFRSWISLMREAEKDV